MSGNDDVRKALTQVRNTVITASGFGQALYANDVLTRIEKAIAALDRPVPAADREADTPTAQGHVEPSREAIAREIDLEACVTLQGREGASRWMYPERRAAALAKADAILALYKPHVGAVGGGWKPIETGASAWRRFSDEKPKKGEFGEQWLLTWSTRVGAYDLGCIDGNWSYGEEISGHPEDLWCWLDINPERLLSAPSSVTPTPPSEGEPDTLADQLAERIADPEWRAKWSAEPDDAALERAVEAFVAARARCETNVTALRAALSALKDPTEHKAPAPPEDKEGERS